MADITASMVKELREKTGAGMMDAKKALVEANGDVEAAVDALRQKGMAKADKKSSRTAAEGLVAIATDGTKGAVVEINSETDFVSRNEDFQNFVKSVSEVALGTSNVEELAATDLNGKSVSDSLTDLIATIGENMALRRSENLEVSEGAVIPYIHGALAPGLGKIGVLVALESSASADVLEGLGKQLAMHIAAAFPKYLDRDSMDDAAVAKERDFLIEQAKAGGKPQEIAEKMVSGRMNKFTSEVSLTGQAFIKDPSTSVAQLLKAKNADVINFVRFEVGEGIEKKTEDFAAEVAAMSS